jgi:hypothetical protein
MKKKMANGLRIPFAHKTPINQNDVPFLEIIQGKDLS